MDRRKQKRKRELKRRKIREGKERQRRIERAEDYAAQAFEAYDDGNHPKALAHTLKALKSLPQDHDLIYLGLFCSDATLDEEAVYSLYLHIWKHGIPVPAETYLNLGILAVQRKDHDLGEKVFQALMDGKVPLSRPLTKAKRKAAQKELNSIRKWRDWERATQEIMGSRKAPASLQGGAETEAAEEQAGSLVREEEEAPAAAQAETADEPRLEPRVEFTLDGSGILNALTEGRRSEAADLTLAREAYELSFRSSFDRLLSLPTLSGVTSLWYQEETARKVMKSFRGRAILADEVGLGKTIEAGLVLKEYALRGLVRSALVLAPSTLVDQWREELENKFGLSFVTSGDALFRRDPAAFWKSPFILASIQTAKRKRHFDAAVARAYDMVIVDEAHHLKNRRTLNWKLVNTVKKNYLLLLTATPVENKLEDLFNLITLLKPGHLSTRKAFMAEFVTRGSPTDPRNREKLRGLLKEVMVRNTRSVTRLNLPPRFATTVQIEPTPGERSFYEAVSDFTRRSGSNGSGLHRMALRKLLEAAGSSVAAAVDRLERMAGRDDGETAGCARELAEAGRGLGRESKLIRLLELLLASPEKKIVYVNALATLRHLHRALKEAEVPHALFHGSLSAAEKQGALERFRTDCPVLLSTGVGGEGHNLQFCHLLVNYDLPWNPMVIEQRIGRLHRIGQEHEVEIYNFCTAGTIEDHVLEVLDRKINMFELVIGEIDMILGRVRGEREFEDMVYDTWIQNSRETDRRKAFNTLAARLKRARSAYETSKELDDKLFREDFDV